jgi:hypothetical protein
VAAANTVAGGIVMAESNDIVPLAQAKCEVELVCRRLGLLHLAFARVLTDELGDDEGRRLVIRSIEAYSRMIGEKKQQILAERGLEATQENLGLVRDIPTIGMHDRVEHVEVDGERRSRAYGCVMAKVWREYGGDDLGRLYCYVDPASVMAYNPDMKLVHTCAEPDGDDYCELTIRPTTDEERADFAHGTSDWAEVDR